MTGQQHEPGEDRPRPAAILLGLLPLALLIAAAVLWVMAATSASATGGCGGG
jgi:hypothetical protein